MIEQKELQGSERSRGWFGMKRALHGYAGLSLIYEYLMEMKMEK
jgi:hypothetical protein